MDVKIFDFGEGFDGSPTSQGAWKDAKGAREDQPDSFRERKISTALCGNTIVIVLGIEGHTHESSLRRGLSQARCNQPDEKGGGEFGFDNRGDPYIYGCSESLGHSVPEVAVSHVLEYLREKAAEYRSQE